MEVRVIYGTVTDRDVEDEINDALAEGWKLRDTHVAVPDPDSEGMISIWLVAVLVRDDDQA